MSSSRERNTQVYIRGFSRKTEKSDLKDAFRKYGKIEEIQLKNGYGFVRYYNYRDANDAVKSMNKKCLGRDDDYRLTVEPAGGRRRERRSGPRGPQDEDECWYCHKKGHWKNECKEFFSGRRRRYSRSYSRERRHRRRSSYSRSSSSSSRSRSSSSSVDSRDKKKKSSRRKRSSFSRSDSRRRRSVSSSSSHERTKKKRRSSPSKSSSRSNSKSKSESRSRSRSKSKSNHPASKSRSRSASKDKK